MKNYVEFVESLIKKDLTMGCRMSLKIHTLTVLLDVFKRNMDAYSQEQGEGFNQNMQQFECRYQGNLRKTCEGVGDTILEEHGCQFGL